MHNSAIALFISMSQHLLVPLIYSYKLSLPLINCMGYSSIPFVRSEIWSIDKKVVYLFNHISIILKKALFIILSEMTTSLYSVEKLSFDGSCY